MNELNTRFQLQDSPRLNADEARLVAQICDGFNSIIAERHSFIARRGLNPAVALPGGLVWGDIQTWGGSFSSFKRKAMDEIALFRAIGNGFNDRPIVVYHDDKLSPHPDRWVRLFCRLATACGERWTVRMPVRFGEVGWNVQGHPVNIQTAYFQETLALMRLTGVAEAMERRESAAPPAILEVGGGFGQMAWILGSIFPKVRWFACDLPESLVHQAVYMAICRPDKRHAIYVGDMPIDGVPSHILIRNVHEAISSTNSVISIPNFLVDDFVDLLTIDLAINVESLSEMTVAQVHHYGSVVSRFLKNGGILFEQNGDHRTKPGGNWCKEHLVQSFAARIDGSKLVSSTPRRGHGDVWANADVALPRSEDLAGSSIAEVLAQQMDEDEPDFSDPRVAQILTRWWQAEEAKPNHGWFGTAERRPLS